MSGCSLHSHSLHNDCPLSQVDEVRGVLPGRVRIYLECGDSGVEIRYRDSFM